MRCVMPDAAAGLRGKTAVITGAAQGIGLGIARAFAAAGARVVVADLQAPAEKDFVHQPCDVRDEESVRELMDCAAVREHGLHILVNNAGVGLEATVCETAVEDWERIMAVNVRGVFLCAKHAAAVMPRGGSIVNIGSIEGSGANPMHAAYAASKGAVHALTRNIALEFGARGIRCNAIAPGWIETPFNEQLLQQYPDVQKARAAIEALHPVRRMGTVDDVAALALFLAGDAAAFLSGQVFVCDGGRTACLPLPPL